MPTDGDVIVKHVAHRVVVVVVTAGLPVGPAGRAVKCPKKSAHCRRSGGHRIIVNVRYR